MTSKVQTIFAQTKYRKCAKSLPLMEKEIIFWKMEKRAEGGKGSWPLLHFQQCLCLSNLRSEVSPFSDC